MKKRIRSYHGYLGVNPSPKPTKKRRRRRVEFTYHLNWTRSSPKRPAVKVNEMRVEIIRDIAGFPCPCLEGIELALRLRHVGGKVAIHTYILIIIASRLCENYT